MADVTLMTGLPTLAVESYNAAIDQLKSANDWLWLAGKWTLLFDHFPLYSTELF